MITVLHRGGLAKMITVLQFAVGEGGGRRAEGGFRQICLILSDGQYLGSILLFLLQIAFFCV